MDRKIFVLFALIFMISNACALGVTPARTTLDFSPNEEKNLSFTILNSEGKDISLVLTVAYSDLGLNNSVILKENTIINHIKSNELNKQIDYKVRLPTQLSPGPHKASITILEISESNSEGETTVGATVGIVTEVYINVPYPGKYAEADLNVLDASQGGEATFVMPILSKGELDLTSVKANIDIYNQLGEKVGTINTPGIEVKSGTRQELVASWKSDVPVGKYLAKAAIDADGQTINLERLFNIGQTSLEIGQIQINNFKLGQIAKFEMLVENKWSETIKEVYVQTQIFNNDGKVMADFSSAHYDIPALGKQMVAAYWDSAGAKAGTYDASLYLKYGDKSSQKNVKLKVSNNNVEVVGFGFVISEKKLSSSNSTLITWLIIILVIANLSWFILLRKKLFKKK
jgi:hypothetical protein